MMNKKKANEAPRVYLYTRVGGNSVFGYIDEHIETAVEHQASCLHFELSEHQHKVVADVREVVSGGITEPALMDMLAEAESGHFDTLYVMSTDRLSRDPDKCLGIVEALDRHGIEVISLKEGCINIPDEPGQPSKLQIAQLIRRADAIARGEMPSATMDEVFDDTIDALPKNQKRNKRRRTTQLKLLQRKRLMGDLGLQEGCVYDRHREKIQRSCGYMRTGNVRHFVCTHPRRKTKSRDRYGSVYTPPKRDIVRIDRMNESDDPTE